MADRIELIGVKAYGYHGVFDFEKRQGQEFIVDTIIWTDFTEAARSDELSDTLSYAEVADLVVRHITGKPYNLIESLSRAIADEIVLFEHVHAVEVTVHKPQAPIEQPFTDVRVVARRNRKDLYRTVLSIGANLGDSRQMITDTLGKLSAMEGVRRVAASGLYETPPWGNQDNPPFINAAAIVEHTMEPLELLHAMQELEQAAGRVRHEHWGPRTLDIDLVQSTKNGVPVHSDTQELTLPHPFAAQRAFVLVPWREIEPEGRLDGRALADLLGQLAPEEVAGISELREV